MTRTYAVTGSSSGIGAATARILRERGEQVIGVDLRGSDVDADLSTPEGRLRAAEDVMTRADGRIDGVIACAGVALPAPVTVAVNYFGVTGFLTALLPALKKSEAPRAATTASLATFLPSAPDLVDACLADEEAKALQIAAGYAEAGPQAGMVVYTSSKRALSRWIRRESVTDAWAGAGIALNAVAPGTVITPMMKDMLATPELIAMVDAQAPMPLNYHQPPESVARLMVWLTSAENSHVTGQTIPVDGGAEAVLRGDDIYSSTDAKLAAGFSPS